MSKKVIYGVFTLITLAMMTTMTSCKKGENDPFLSLRSRKARITGEWKLQEGVTTNTNGLGVTPVTTSTSYTEGTCTTNGFSIPYTETLTIEDDGVYSLSIMENGVEYFEKGVWFFADKVKDLDLKKKEAIVFVLEESSQPGLVSTYSGVSYGEPLMIDQLKNKEIIFKGTTSTTAGSLNGDSSNSYDKTFVKQ